MSGVDSNFKRFGSTNGDKQKSKGKKKVIGKKKKQGTKKYDSKVGYSEGAEEQKTTSFGDSQSNFNVDPSSIPQT